MNTTRDLAPDYYLSNFHFLVNWVVNRYEDVLSREEKHFVNTFQNLPHQSQCLYVRLASRKGKFFRAGKLRYQEIGCIESAASHLIQCSLIDTHTNLSVIDISQVLTKPELQQLFDQNEKKAERKIEIIDRLAEHYPQTKTWQEWTAGQFGQLYRLNAQDILDNFILLFFGNSYQDLTEFVLQDIGLFRYENYPIDSQHRIFKTRDELVQYQELIKLREQLSLAASAEDLVSIVKNIPNSASSEPLLRRRSKLCNQLAYAIAQQNNHTLALDLYSQSHLAPARERRVRLLEKQGMYEDAWELLDTVFQNPLDENELQVADRIAKRLAKKLGKSHNSKATQKLVEKNIALLRFDNELNVEEITRQHFNCDSTPCVYVENQLLLGLFGLWLWPEMFRGIDGAFANPFQSAPLDIYEPTFSAKRPLIAELFTLFENDSYKSHIKDIWKTKNGLSNYFVNWNFLNETLINIALESIPANHLKLIFQRILFDIRNNRSGLPDLIQFFPENHNYLMIEVKGPGDRIQDNQRRWLNFFSEHKMPAEVVYVSWE